LLRDVIVFAIETGIRHGERHEVFNALRGLDPLLRSVAQARLTAALRFSELNTSVEAPAHRFRVAALHLAKILPEEGFEDPAAVGREYERLRARCRPPRKGPWLLATVGVVLLLGAVALVAFRVVSAPFDPRNESAGSLLGPALTDFVAAGAEEVGASNVRIERMKGQAHDAFGERAATALSRMLVEAVQLRRAEDPSGERMDRLLNATTDFDTFLAEGDHPYFIDVDEYGGRERTLPLLLSFYIERERRVEAAGRAIRVVHLWRLDELAVRQGYLGYTRPHTPAALVLLDQVEEDLIGDVLPALPEREVMEFVDFATRHRGEPWVKDVEAAAAKAVRKHFAAMPEAQRRRHEAVGELLARRRKLVHDWQLTTRALGERLRVPRRLIPEADYLGDLELKVPRDQLRSWESIHEQLLEQQHLSAFHQLRDNYVHAVERHEVQHRIDYARELFAVPQVLAERLGLENPLGASAGTLAGRSRDELSAYLASIATAEPTPHLQLALLCRHLFDERTLGGPYSYAALGAFESIARELGIQAAALEKRVLKRPDFAELVVQVLSRESTELRDAAKRVYEKQYETALTEPKLVTQRDFAVWRH
jgi:hypothetical protein